LFDFTFLALLVDVDVVTPYSTLLFF